MARSATVAIVGRPNVGKSTLFNRLVGKRQAIVHDQPGVTRDRITGRVAIEGEGSVDLVDTGGLVLGDDPIGLNRQVFLAIEESDLVLLVVDGKEGLNPGDQEIAERLRRLGRPTILVLNKGDVRASRDRAYEFYELGLGEPLAVSAEHGLGIAELLSTMAERLPAGTAQVDDGLPRLAIVGRPNVGKSSLLNRILGQERSLVAAEAGTTRDPVDSTVEVDGRSYTLVDTAGIRRRSKVSGAPEELAVMMARRQIEGADAALLLIDGGQGLTSGDLTIAGLIWELGKPAVVVVNKWDLVDAEARERLERDWPRLDELLSDPERVNLSVLSGRGLGKLFSAVERALATLELELPTSEVNRLLEEAIRRHQPPLQQGKRWKLYYATQVSSRPPTFMLFGNRRLSRTSSYRRYLVNSLRRATGLRGIPIRLVVRRKGEE